MIRRFVSGHMKETMSPSSKAKELERRLAKLTLVKPPPPRKIGCKACLMVENLAKKFSSFKTCTSSTLIKYYSKTAVLQSIGDHLAIIGDNGAGKSTLLKLLLGEEKPYGGTIKLGSSLQIGYLPQQLQFADPDSRLLAYAITLTGNEEVARRQLAKSGFYQSDVGKRIKDLSGGEKSVWRC